MPIQSSFGSLSYPKFSFLSISSNTGYILSGPGRGYGPGVVVGAGGAGWGTGISIDTNGNLYLGLSNSSNARNGNGYLNKFDSNANTIYSNVRYIGATPTYFSNNVYYAQIQYDSANLVYLGKTIKVSANANIGNAINEVQYFSTNTIPKISGIRNNNNNTYALYTYGNNAGFPWSNAWVYVANSNNNVNKRIKYFFNANPLTSVTTGRNISVDTNGNIFTLIHISGAFANSNNTLYLTKVSNNFVKSYEKEIYISGLNIGTDSPDITANSNFVYIRYPAGFIKCDNSTGNILVQKYVELNGSGNLKLDTDGNVYSWDGGSINCMDANLNVLWKNSFKYPFGTMAGLNPIGLETDANSIYCTGFSFGTYQNTWSFKLPKDGSIPGAIGNLTFATYNFYGTTITYFKNSIPNLANTSLMANNTSNVGVTVANVSNTPSNLSFTMSNSITYSSKLI